MTNNSNHVRRYLAVLIMALLCTHQCYATGSTWQRFKSLIGLPAYQAYSEHRSVLKSPGTLTVHNVSGNITVTTSKRNNTVYVKATKRARTQDIADHLQLKTSAAEMSENADLTITTNDDPLHSKGIIDLEIMVPHHAALHLTTKKGNINIARVEGPLSLQTDTGNIFVESVRDIVTAHIEGEGSINITDAQGPINATLKKGPIRIEHARNSIIAHTDSGAITTTCCNVPKTGTISLSTLKGHVVLGLPATTHAHLYAHTNRGTLTSDLMITLKQHATKLNKESWKRFTQEAHGILGLGHADIHISCVSGNIKISQYKGT